jgi:hypothetical protein
MTERTWLLVGIGLVSFVIPVDVLLALTHRSYNNLVLVAHGGWSYERALEPAKFELVTLII